MVKITSELLNKLELKLDFKIFSYESLGDGNHNINFVLKTSKGNFVLRIYANSQFNNSLKEFKILKKLDGFHAPKVYFFDDSKNVLEFDYLIQEFIEGSVLKNFSESDFKEVVRILKDINKIKDVNELKNSKESIGFWTKNNLLKNSELLGFEFNSEMKKIYSKVIVKFKESDSLISKYEPIHLIHNDLIPSNIIRKPNGDLVFIDWEFANFNYFFSDLAIFIVGNLLSKKDELLVLKEYGFGLSSDEKKLILREKLKASLVNIAWLIERISSFKQGKQLIHKSDSVEKYQNSLEKNLNYINSLLD